MKSSKLLNILRKRIIFLQFKKKRLLKSRIFDLRKLIILLIIKMMQIMILFKKQTPYNTLIINDKKSIYGAFLIKQQKEI